MKKSIFLFFAAILCSVSASAWSYKSAANNWTASTSGFKNVTMNSGKTVDVVMLKDVGDGVNICQNDNGSGHTLYCKWTKTSGDIFRGTARWNNGLYCDETVVVPGGKVYIKVGSGTQVQMTAGTDYTYTADVTFSNTGQSYTISGGTVSGATITNENSMPSGGKPASLTMKNSYTSKNAGSVHIVFDLRTNKVTEEVASEPEPEQTVTLYFVNHPEWTNLKAHVWDNNSTPYKDWNNSESMTDTGLDKDGYAVYSYTFPSKYTNIIFKGDGQQTQDNVAAYDAAKPYFCDDKWYASLAEIPALGAVVTYDYYIAGPLAGGWNATQMGMEKAAEGQYTCEFTKDAGDYQFKVTNGKWGNETGGFDCADVEGSYEEVSNVDGNVNVKLTTTTTFTVKFNSNTKKITFEGLTPYVAPLTYTVTVPAGTEKCYIAGPKNDWSFQEMTATANANEFTITIAGAKETDGYKYACQASWDYVEKKEDGNDLDANRTWSANDVVAKWGVPPIYTIVGATAITGANWDLANAENIMAKDGEAYTLTKTGLKLETGDYEYKVAKNAAWGDGQYPAEGNQKVTITETAEYTIVYTYTVGTSLTAVATKTGEYTPVQTVYTVAGDAALCGSDWKADDTTNDMTDNGDGTFTWEKTDVKLTSNVGFKVVKNHDFGNGEYPAENWNINLVDYEGAAVYTVTITFTESSKEIAVTLTKTGEATPPVISYVLMGVADDWTTGIELTLNEANTEFEEYMLLGQAISATDAVKVVKLVDGVKNTFCGDVKEGSAEHTADADGNIVLAEGTYDFYYDVPANKVYIGASTPATPTPDYTREVPIGYYATMCLPNATSKYEGAEIYEVAWMEFKDDKAIGLYLDQVAAGTTLEAGKPYIFKATAVTQEFYYEGKAVSTPVDGANGLRGTLEGIAAGSLTDNYIIADNKFWVATASNYLDANRAYIDATEVEKSEPAQIPGRRRVSLGAAGENAETGIDNIITTDTPVKVIENGQLIIIRNGEKFNVQGIKL